MKKIRLGEIEIRDRITSLRGTKTTVRVHVARMSRHHPQFLRRLCGSRATVTPNPPVCIGFFKREKSYCRTGQDREGCHESTSSYSRDKTRYVPGNLRTKVLRIKLFIDPNAAKKKNRTNVLMLISPSYLTPSLQAIYSPSL